MIKITTYRLAEKPAQEGFYERQSMDIEPAYYSIFDEDPRGDVLEKLVSEHVDAISDGAARVLSVMDSFIGWGVVVSIEYDGVTQIRELLSFDVETVQGMEEVTE